MSRSSKWMPKMTALAALIGASGAGGAVAAPLRPTEIGIDLAGIAPHLKARAFANLVAGSQWKLAPAKGKWTDYPAELLDQNGNLRSIPSGASASLQLTQAHLSPAGTDIRCVYQGKASVTVKQGATNVSSKAGIVQFRLPSGEKANGALVVTEMDESAPIRNIDCRETALSPTDRFDPAFVKWLQGFKVLRYMDWQRTNTNPIVTWGTRRTPQTFNINTGSGVPVEDMVALAKLTSTDAWFNMPWNADDDYVAQFAQYVHDNLPADRKVYVEVSNEIWNWRFAATKQAAKEGVAEGLSDNPGKAFLLRYAERTTQVMTIWEKVFARDPQRLIRVVSTQHSVPGRADTIMTYRDTAKHVDALATAPYFNFNAKKIPVDSASAALDLLEADLEPTLAHARAAKAIASKYGKRYITYEAGQGLILPNVEIQKQAQRDPRMEAFYDRFIDRWRAEIGDTLMLFATVYPIGKFGAWGLVEYAGQPANDAPKLRAVRRQLAK